MDRFEYLVIPWDPSAPPEQVQRGLNDLGAQGWEAVSLAPRRAPTPMPGVGVDASNEMVILMKRRMGAG